MKRLFVILLMLTVMGGVVSADTAILYTTDATDGYVYVEGTNQTYTDLRNDVGMFNSVDVSGITAYARVSSDLETNTYNQNFRGIIIFDGSSLPDDAIITSAQVGLSGNASNITLGDLGIGITKFNIDAAISADDYDNFEYSRFANDAAISTLPESYNNWTLNSLGLSNISKTSTFGFGVLTSADIDLVDPTWASNTYSYFKFSTAEGVIRPPYIEITYTPTDTTPPASITGLNNTTTCNSINWTFTPPGDADYDGLMNWFNGTLQSNLTKTDTFKLFPGLAEDTDYTFSTKTFDNATPANVNATFVNMTAHTSVCADTTPTPTQTSPFDSGGSDSGESGRPTSFVTMSPGATAGQTMTFTIHQPLTAGSVNYPYAIITVEIVPSQTLGATELIIADTTKTDTSQPSGRLTAGIVRIEIPGVNPSLISKGTITFNVAGFWLTQHGLTPDDIVLMANSGGQWSEIPTTFVNQNKETYSFTATTPGFLNFAITSRVNTTTGNATMVNAVEPTGSGVTSSSTVAVTTPSTVAAAVTIPSNATQAAILLSQPPATQSPLSMIGVILSLFILFIARRTGKM